MRSMDRVHPMEKTAQRTRERQREREEREKKSLSFLTCLGLQSLKSTDS